MTPSSKKPGVAFRATVAVVAGLLAYPLSFGPAIWLTSRGHLESRTVERVYRPVLIGLAYGPDSFSRAVTWWASLGIAEDGRVGLALKTDHIVANFYF